MPKILALVPAHNEEACIANAIQGLQTQTVVPDEIVVVADNCSDDTERLSRMHGVQVFRTFGNKDKKAGALNQAIGTAIPYMHDDDYVMVTDADSVVDPAFIESALRKLEDRRYGGVGGVFRGDPGSGFVGHLQRNEYARYARDIRRLGGKCLVITGTAAIFPVRVLREILVGRKAGVLPFGMGVYDTTVMTEDNELSFAIMHLGYKIHTPDGCTLTTEVMPTWRALWRQRRRWKAGAVENCMQYGLTKVTARYWGRQIFTMLGVAVTFAYLGSLALIPFTGFTFQPIWLAIMGVFMLERAVTLKDRGWKRAALAFTMYELPYDMFLQACHGAAYWRVATRRTKEW
jgi:biofilm PGA synthesis N-glycosyltransferase PgaC